MNLDSLTRVRELATQYDNLSKALENCEKAMQCANPTVLVTINWRHSSEVTLKALPLLPILNQEIQNVLDELDTLGVKVA